MSHEKGEDRVNALMEFDELLLISQCHSKGRRYPVIKVGSLTTIQKLKTLE